MQRENGIHNHNFSMKLNDRNNRNNIPLTTPSFPLTSTTPTPTAPTPSPCNSPLLATKILDSSLAPCVPSLTLSVNGPHSLSASSRNDTTSLAVFLAIESQMAARKRGYSHAVSAAWEAAV